MRVQWTAVWLNAHTQEVQACRRTMEHHQLCVMLSDSPWAHRFIEDCSLVVATDLDTRATVVLKNRVGSAGTVQADGRPALIGHKSCCKSDDPACRGGCW